ncbi:hypothetical protein [Paenibacillus graminis]|uniref:hypothetical protein n=1 Tax=Paenibacillus graminis TaxID=189425 RepID=UPI002DBF42B1|nr:hypothetical protein [Paenibacillus graminis]MEC0170421.1 hypothetical protein [Paenibacillus graminis]
MKSGYHDPIFRRCVTAVRLLELTIVVIVLPHLISYVTLISEPRQSSLLQDACRGFGFF